MTPSIAFVYFDLGNILVAFDRRVSTENLAALTGASVAAVEDAVYTSGAEDDWESGRVGGEKFVRRVMDGLNITEQERVDRGLSDAAVLDGLSDMFTPIDDMTGVIGAVRSGNRRVGLLSNTCRSHWDWIGRQAYRVLAEPFDATVLSYEVGAMKPASGIYEAAEAAAGCDPGEILFVDDKPENVEAATRRGWRAEVTRGGPRAIEVLRRHGVLDAS